MTTLVFDIETVGESWEDMDAPTRAFFEQRARADAESEEGAAGVLEKMKGEFGLSPLTGEIVAIGTFIVDAQGGERGAVYYQAPGGSPEVIEEGGIKYEAMDEATMLAKFWELVRYAQTFVSFNGRTFDAPFLIIRSAAHRIRPTKDLMRGRFLYQQLQGAQHVDLKEQLTFYGATNKRHALHLYCRTFGIESPKGEEADGSKVGAMFRERRFLDIARYNARDIRATKQLYDVWRNYVQLQ